MKKLLIVFAMALFTLTGSAQKLVDIYMKGTVKLVPDKEYGQQNDWNKVFETYNDTLYGKHMGNRKNITLMPDGSVVVDHPYRNFYSMFSPDGKFVKEFGIKNSKGVQYKKINQIAGVINNKTLYTNLDNMGNMVCFDFNGNYLKTLKLDYMTRQMIALPNNKIAVVGWVIWKEKFREFVSLVNFDTNEEKVIWEHFTDRCEPDKQCKLFNYSYTFEKQGMISFNTMPYANPTGMSASPIIATTGNQLIVAIPSTGEIHMFDLNGNRLGMEKVSWANNFISVEEQKDIQRKAIERYKNIEKPMFAGWVSEEENELALKTMVKSMEQDLTKITEPIPIPAISTVIKDSDGNLLFFEYPKEENANKFNVWIMQNGGKFVCQSSFVCDEYDLQINPSKMAFSNGMIYGLQKLKKVDGVPLRLARFKLE
ncbi:MAG TPA: hypothetical protein VFG54_15680 [Prolixibacteraceae bacterium]|nr:hypothetical protein [Prolixibacteraceae bacterium]